MQFELKKPMPFPKAPIQECLVQILYFLEGGVPDETNAVLQENPLLSDRVAGDCHIAEGSPAQGNGREVPRDALADFDQVGTGAFEFH